VRYHLNLAVKPDAGGLAPAYYIGNVQYFINGCGQGSLGWQATCDRGISISASCLQAGDNLIAAMCEGLAGQNTFDLLLAGYGGVAAGTRSWGQVKAIYR